MRATEQLGRYQLLDLVAQDAGEAGRQDVYLWRAYDDVLDRSVAVRVLAADDPRAAAVLGAAQAAARVDDRRLLRVLDILNLPSTEEDDARIAVVTEWTSGRNLERTLQDRRGRPFPAAEALALVAEVSRALAAAGAGGVAHGRLRPSSVFISDAGEVRIRGLSVDAALFGPMLDSTGAEPSDRVQADVDALGSLAYLLTTGSWPGATTLTAPAAPRAGQTVLPPSQVRAGVPRLVDDIVARSVSAAARPRGVARVPDAGAFATMTGAALDHLVPMTTVAPGGRPRSAGRTALLWVGRLVAVVLALALVAGIAWTGWQLLLGGSDTRTTGDAVDEQILTSPAVPVDELPTTGLDRVFTITEIRSFDPYGDDNGNGKPDRRRGRENDELAVTVNDSDPVTAWLTEEYATPDLDGKPGVGLVLDLGAPQDVQEVALRLVGRGSDVTVAVSDQINPDPALWTPLASAVGARERLTVRAPRPVNGRYVLIWFTQVPPAEELGTGIYQGGVRRVEVRG